MLSLLKHFSQNFCRGTNLNFVIFTERDEKLLNVFKAQLGKLLPPEMYCRWSLFCQRRALLPVEARTWPPVRAARTPWQRSNDGWWSAGGSAYPSAPRIAPRSYLPTAPCTPGHSLSWQGLAPTRRPTCPRTPPLCTPTSPVKYSAWSIYGVARENARIAI